MIGLTCMMSRTDNIILQQKRMIQGAHTCLRMLTASLKHLRVIMTFLQSQKSSTRGSQRQDLLLKYLHLWIHVLHRWTSKINIGPLKPMIKSFDSGWSYILNLFSKLILLLAIWSCNCSNITKKKVTHLNSSIVQGFWSTLNSIPQWISKPQIKRSF